MALVFQLLLVLLLGASVGSFLNVCIARLPLEKSLLWPGSRCGHCLQPIRWYDNLPLLSYWILRGRCRVCGATFSTRYFLIELFTALSLVGLYYLEVLANVHHLDAGLLRGYSHAWGPGLGVDRYDMVRVMVFLYHAVLFCFLLVAAFCDLDGQAIPLSLTVSGTVIGLVGSVLFAWPWPYTPAQALEETYPKHNGLYPWPVWSPLPDWLQPGGNWQTGLATGVAGLLAGTLVLRAVRLLFGLGVGAEYMEPEQPEAASAGTWAGSRWLSWLGRVGGKALGLGDADLMMMAGSFLGWQPIIVAFFVGVFPGLAFGLVQLAVRGNRPMPFGPALAVGVVITWLAWDWISPDYKGIFFDGPLLGIVVGLACVLMLLAAFGIRLLRSVRG